MGIYVKFDDVVVEIGYFEIVYYDVYNYWRILVMLVNEKRVNKFVEFIF